MRNLLCLLSIIITTTVYSQEPGNVISEYGKTFHVPSPDFKTDTTSVFKVVFDVNRSFDPSKPNNLMETAARFLNMHEKEGVDPENMKLALVIHGKAVQDVLKDKFYDKKFSEVKENPNLPLIDALAKNGVEIILCGQSAAHYEVTPEKVHDQVKFALSAMTALVQLQNNDYQLIKF
ncbi:Intracellular sulfur oxidation protein, DsrE/DsrF family [Salinimicrobium catena]|uniref:Intracellular sulfur oxidation protein, DsrE/DsrF family n=1 Tax=Salinimicrobium catena TaxID=390640 RepID=A0A1H5L755_9FLAO|nr:DsrE family protein [Salinimicrobium catena]SDL05689.1 Intracellular sulfur oxidation protein, DsrE/DsrF family [Salinimicrobium catena]SEE72028.1 Intracellular sulfur oxidation protein, DsrE/DsrF family [Salinimicrobium catena]